jgi:hypothetical protein
MFRILFTTLALPTGGIATVYLLMTLVGAGAGARPRPRAESVTAALASLLVIGLLGWGANLAWRRDAPGLACALVPLSWALFAGAMLAQGLINNRSWQ